MLQQAVDFRDESDALHALLKTLPEADWSRATQFKGWRVNDVVAHLHFGNYAADLSLSDEAAFKAFAADYQGAKQRGVHMLEFTHAWLKGTAGPALLALWHDYYQEMAQRFAAADPRKRVLWFGPDMSVRSSISARLMETWAHGQEIYDLLGQPCVQSDRIRNIVVMGVNTFQWTFSNRGLAVPAQQPYLRLEAPSGDIWEWNEPSADNAIEGSALAFCQVVTQVRNIADTGLRVVGDTATRWMAMAQCFAGPPEDPPAPGSRFMVAAG